MYYGDLVPGQVLRVSFNTSGLDATPITLAGSPVVSVYKDGSTTETASGASISVDFDARTGMHRVTIDTSADATFYSPNSDFSVVLTTGTVSGTSAVGKQIAAFSINNRSSSLIQYKATATAGSASTVTLPASASAVNDFYRGSLFAVVGGTGVGQSTRVCTGYVGSTKVATFARNWVVSPDATSIIAIMADQSPVLSSSLGVSVAAYETGQDPAALMSTAGYTATRAGYLDRLDAAITTRSTYAGGDTSGTATLVARLTSQRATNLDNLDAAVSTRLATSGYTAPPTDYQQRAVAVTLPASPPAGYADSTTLGTVQTLVSAINTAIVTSQTTGAVVDNTGTTLAFTVSGMSQSKSYIGMQVAFTSGANSASRQIITGQANSASNLRLSVTTPFGAAPSSGDTVSVF